MRFNFENLHKSQKHAFVDGLACGIVLSVMAAGFYKAYQEMRAEKRLIEECEKKEKAISVE